MRRPAEPMPQRRLVYELRALIDRGRLEEAALLTLAHPKGIVSSHVFRGLGARRRASLIGYFDPKPARSVRSDG